MPLYSSSIFFDTCQREKEERIALASSRSNLCDVNIRLSLLRHIKKQMNELIISNIRIYSRHTRVRLIFVYVFILVFYSVLIYGNRSSFSNQTHTMLSYMQINIRCTTTTCRECRRFERGNNKQHAVGIEQISKKKRKAHCVHGCSTEINILMNGLWMKEITVKEREREKKEKNG